MEESVEVSIEPLMDESMEEVDHVSEVERVAIEAMRGNYIEEQAALP